MARFAYSYIIGIAEEEIRMGDCVVADCRTGIVRKVDCKPGAVLEIPMTIKATAINEDKPLVTRKIRVPQMPA